MNMSTLLKLTQPSNFVADRVYTNTDWKGNKTTMYSKQVGKSTYHSSSLTDLETMCKNHIEVNNDGAKFYYDGKTFNND